MVCVVFVICIIVRLSWEKMADYEMKFLGYKWAEDGGKIIEMVEGY